MACSPALEGDRALDVFIRQPVNREMIRYLAHKASSVIRCEQTTVQKTSRTKLPPTPPRTPPEGASHDAALPSLEAFITSLVERSHVQVATLMSSLVYLDRLHRRLPPVAKGMRCTVHRIFLAALILAAKNLNDSSPKNKHWARYSCVRGYDGFGFSVTEVNLMEKQLLFLLDWDLRITNDDLLTQLEPFLAPIRVEMRRRVEEDEMARRTKLRERDMLRRHHRDVLAARAPEPRMRLLDVQAYDLPEHAYVPEPLRPTLASCTYSSQRQERDHHARQPSLSPASFLDVPGLIRTDTLSSSSRSSSSHGTPDSSAGSYVDVDDQVYLAGQHDLSPSPVMHMRPSQPFKVHTLSLDRFEDGKPPKKLKTGGNILSRFLGVGSTERYERLNPRSRTQYV